MDYLMEVCADQLSRSLALALALSLSLSSLC